MSRVSPFYLGVIVGMLSMVAIQIIVVTLIEWGG